MTQTTLTTAGHMCHAGDARLAAGSHGVYGHRSATWTQGAFIAEPTAVFAVLDKKNRPTRQPQGVSP
jgi:hypothetical protein